MDKLLQDVDAFWALFEMAPDAILIFEAEGERRGRIVAANQRAVEQLGYEPGELCAMTVMDLEGPDAHAAVERVIEGALASQEVAVELTHRRKDASCNASAPTTSCGRPTSSCRTSSPRSSA